jgi:hypothetical protein
LGQKTFLRWVHVIYYHYATRKLFVNCPEYLRRIGVCDINTGNRRGEICFKPGYDARRILNC